MPPIPKIKTGVYAIRQLSTLKIYIGSCSSSRGFQGRFSAHLCELKQGKHHSRYLQRAWDKYGRKDFVFMIVERCFPSKCLEREQYWMDKFGSANPDKGFNLCPIAGNCAGVKHTEETKAKVSLATRGRKQSKEAIEKSASKRRGRKRSEETRKRISEAANKRRETEDREAWSILIKQKVVSDKTREVSSRNGKASKGRKHSEETKKKMREKRIQFWRDEENKKRMILIRHQRMLVE